MPQEGAAHAPVIGPLRLECLDAVVAIHREELSYSVNSRLGPAHVKSLYRALASDPLCRVAVAYTGGEPVGVVSATLDLGQLQASLRQQLGVSGLARVVARFLLRPHLAIEHLRSARRERPVVVQGHVVEAFLLALAVRADAKRGGIGRLLVQAVDDFCRAGGARAYHLTTRAENRTSREFYRRLGFVEVGERAPDVVVVRTLERV